MGSDVAQLTNELTATIGDIKDWGSLMELGGELADALVRAGVDVARHGPLPDEMNVIVPYAGGAHLPTVLDTLATECIVPRAISVGGDPTAYWAMFVALWATGERVIVVEHDVLPWPGALGELWRCAEPWCAFPYQLNGSMLTGNGCTKFSAEFMADAPGLWRDIQTRTWLTLDTVFAAAASEQGYEVHRHGPPVIHLNPAHIANPDRNWIVALLADAVALLERQEEVGVDG